MKRYIITAVLTLCSAVTIAQDNITQMAVNLPQALHLNPAKRPDRGFVSIPIIGSLSIGVSNSFSLSDVISNRNCGNYLDLPALISKSVANGNSLITNVDLDIINAGFYVSPNDFIGITVRTRAHVATSYPLGLFEFISDNTLGSQRTYDISMSPNVLGWAEVGVSYSRSVGRNFTFGARLKYIEGLIGVQAQDGINFRVDKNYDQYLLSANYTANLGGLALSNGTPQMNYAGFQNSGVGFDVGATYISDDQRINASISASDIGAIWWDGAGSTVLQVTSPEAQFEFNGMGNLLGGQSMGFDVLVDSILTSFNETVGLDTLNGRGFHTSLPTTFQAMGSYSLGDNLQHNVSLGFIGQIPYKGSFDYAISAGYAYRSPNEVWQLMANYTYMRNNPVNVGLGVVMTTGVFQLYMATDNLLSVFNAANSKNLNFSLGMSFFFGPRSVIN